MNLLPSITLSNLITVLCRILSCDSDFEYPLNDEDLKASSRVEKRFESENDINAPVKQGDAPEVVTDYGRIRGYYMTIVRGRNISAFEGIPYAESPHGDKRFRDPVPKKPWEGTLEAKAVGPICMQLHYGRLMGSEEGCLTVNVYTRNVQPVKPYPVIIFIHGGFWVSGSGSHYGPTYLLDNEVILVTFNYRLGVLGFWSTGDEVALGNFGMKDQALLINWVYENIAQFGGDPKRITITGSSAGATSAHLHMMSNSESKNKISSAISWSGTGYNIWGLVMYNTSVTVSKAMANISGCETTLGSKFMLECMRGIDADVLVANQLLTFRYGFFIPSIEADLPGAFLAHNADEAYRLNKVARIPWIATMTSREGNLPVTVLQANLVVTLLRGAFNSDLLGILSVRSGNVNENLVKDKILEYYTGRKGTSLDLAQDEFSKIATDRYFSVPIHKALQMHSQIAPTYGALFSYASKLGRAGKLGFANHAEFGVLHGDDLTYLLNSTRHHPPIRRYDSHFAITKLLVNLYGNFARFGEPLYIDEEKQQHRIWDAVRDPNNFRYLNIDEEVKMIDDPYKNASKFWEALKIPDMTPFFKVY